MTDKDMMAALQSKVLWLACWMIHTANHLRDGDEIKVGGHQASSASMVSIMTVLYFSVLRPEDRVAVKPHAAPVFHAILYLLGNQQLDLLLKIVFVEFRARDCRFIGARPIYVAVGKARIEFLMRCRGYTNLRIESTNTSLRFFALHEPL